MCLEKLDHYRVALGRVWWKALTITHVMYNMIDEIPASILVALW